jgi:hypothetical protein
MVKGVRLESQSPTKHQNKPDGVINHVDSEYNKC